MSVIVIERAMISLAWLGLVHGLWLGLAAPVLATLIFKARPGLPTQARHKILLGAFLLATVGPFIAATAHREATQRSASVADRSATAALASTASSALRPGQFREPPLQGPIRLDGGMPVVWLVRAARPWILACWASGMCGMAVLVFVAFGSSLRLLRQCRPAPEPVEREARRMSRRLALRRSPPVLVHDTLVEPCLCGVFRPSIVLPADWLREARPGVVSAVLAHELAHARRRDPLANLLNRFLEALVLFHPGVRRLSRSLRLQREHRADALALRLTGDARSLAEALEGFAQFRLAPRLRSPLGAALGGESSSLLPRIQEILGMKSKPEQNGLWPVLTLPAAGLLALLACTSGLALDEPPAKPAVVAQPQGDGERTDVPDVSYEVALVEGLDKPSFGLDFDFLVGPKDEPIGIAFLSDLERNLLIQSVMHSPSGRLHQAPNVTARSGEKASVRFPHESGPDRIVDVTGIAVKPSGKFDPRYVRITIRLTAEPRGVSHRTWKESKPREVTYTLPSGGTVLVSTDDPNDPFLRGRTGVIMVTPHRVSKE